MRVLHFSVAYGYWGDLDPRCLDDETKGQVGGGETAMLNTCFELQKRGHGVTCAFRCAPGVYRGVRFRTMREAQDLAYTKPWDAIVSWDNVEPLLPLKGEGVQLVCSNQMNFISPLGHGEDEILFVSPSRSHARLMQAAFEVKRVAAIPNALDPSWFTEGATIKRDPYKVMYASSPDRGLHHLLDLWPKIHRAVPQAHLHVYYEIERWFDVMAHIGKYGDPQIKDAGLIIRAHKYNPPPGVVFEGAKHPRQIAREMCSAGVLAYPCDTISFTEGFGTTVLQAYASGMLPITTDTDAFAEVYGEKSDAIPLVGYDGEPNPLVSRARIADDFADRLVAAIRSMAALSRPGWAFGGPGSQGAILNRYSWLMVGGLWDALLRGETVFWPEQVAA